MPTIAPSTLMLTLLGAASLILYFAGRVVMGAIPARADGATARAALGAMPVFVVSLVAAAMDRPQIALHLPLACATAAMTFGLGTVLVGRPVDGDGSRSWALLLPAVAMTLIATLGGALTLGACGAIAFFGGLALLAWRADALPAVRPTPRDRRDARVAVLTWTIATLAVAVAGAMAMVGLPALERLRQMPSDALATAFLLSPAIVVPIVFELLPPCRPIGWSASVSSLVKFSLICITLALPLAAVGVAARPTIAAYVATTQVRRATTLPTTTPVLFSSTRPAATTTPSDAAPPTAAALATNVVKYPSLPGVPQRSDLLVLAGVALLLLPLATGAFRAGRMEAVALIACYVFDLVLTMAMVVR